MRRTVPLGTRWTLGRVVSGVLPPVFQLLFGRPPPQRQEQLFKVRRLEVVAGLTGVGGNRFLFFVFL